MLISADFGMGPDPFYYGRFQYSKIRRKNEAVDSKNFQAEFIWDGFIVDVRNVIKDLR